VPSTSLDFIGPSPVSTSSPIADVKPLKLVFPALSVYQAIRESNHLKLRVLGGIRGSVEA
jgi:hypothetical protein